jgi:spore coat protein U-like protein
MIKSLRVAAAVATLLAAAGPAQAATTTTTFNVTATVLANCSVTASALSFGNYTPSAGALTGSTTLQVRCTRNTAYTVDLNAGTTAGGTLAQRLMRHASTTDTLQYNLYTTNALTTVFGNGTGGTGNGSGTGNGMAAAATSITVYGQLPDSTANQDAPTGAYSDTITVTVTY